LKEKDQFADKYVYARITLKYTIKNMKGWGGLDCSGARQGQLAGT